MSICILIIHPLAVLQAFLVRNQNEIPSKGFAYCLKIIEIVSHATFSSFFTLCRTVLLPAMYEFLPRSDDINQRFMTWHHHSIFLLKTEV